MERIECTIQVTWQHRVLFSDQVFNPANRVLRDVLAGDPAGEPRKSLVVLDQSLALARPKATATISAYFAAHAAAVKLVCPPLLIPGGEK
ncbi:MAG TPA: hypothetical protein VNT26_06355, partial [Candidatus Sulfotelmatobacter sp.]|nr:hypothetical protein [Candidatus Sulfotelmatobacter sp.]